jgi:hypothetical protein
MSFFITIVLGENDCPPAKSLLNPSFSSPLGVFQPHFSGVAGLSLDLFAEIIDPQRITRGSECRMTCRCGK